MISGLLLILELLFRRFDKNRRIFKIRKKYCLVVQRRSRIHGPATPFPLPRLDREAFTAAAFLELSKNLSHPIVMKGFLKDTKACLNWSFDYFFGNYGDSLYEHYEDATKAAPEVKKFKASFSPLREGLGAVKRGEVTYLNNFSTIFLEHPELINDLSLENLLKILPKERNTECFDMLHLFMGGKGSGTPMHCAFEGNFFCNIVGHKRWRLIDPKYSKYLLPVLAKPFFYSDTYFEPDTPGRNQFTINLPSFEVLLEPGDILYNAPWWWHRVDNLDTFTIGCAVRHFNPRGDYSNNFLFTVMSPEPLMVLFKSFINLRKRLTGYKKNFRDVLLEKVKQELMGQKDL